MPNRSAAAAVGLFSAILAQPFAAAPAWASDHTIIAATGSPAPSGGTIFRFNSVAMNDRGEIAFDAFLLGPSGTGIFARDGRTTRTVALGGNPDPASGDFGFVLSPAIDGRGDVAFNADADILRSDGRRIEPLMQDGAAAPGGGTLLGPVAFSANSHGNIGYLAFLDGSDSTEGIFFRKGRKTFEVARDNQPSPIGGTFLFFSEPVMGSDQVAFYAGLDGAPGDFGIFRGGDDGVTAIFAANQQGPRGVTFMDFGNPVINEHGEVAAVGQLQNGPLIAGLFRSDGREISVIALDGDDAPDGGKFSGSFFLPTRINARGQVAFHASLAQGTSARGIFRSDGRAATAIALQGAAAPGTASTFSGFRDIQLQKDGTVTFIGTLTIGVGGVDATNNAGIWVGTSASDLRLVVRTGQAIDGRTLISLPANVGQLAASERSIAWVGGFASRAQAIVVSQIGD